MKNLLKSKAAMSLLLIGLAAIIIGGATQAWFTAEDTIDNATFTAGTVIVNADGPGGNYAELNRNLNVNPGDCGVITWNIVNEGSKAARLRVQLDDVWTDVIDGVDDPDPFYFLQPDSSDWVMYDDGEGGLWLYYKNDVPGTFNSADPNSPNAPASVELKLVYAFDGATMDNDYQEAGLTLGGKVEAIQASHEASTLDENWATGWNAITNGDPLTGEALLNYEYFHTGAGKDSECWKANNGGSQQDPEPNTVVANILPGDLSGTVSGTGSFLPGTDVTLTAPATIDGYTFKGWTVNSPADLVYTETGNTLSFTMPDAGVSVTANYDPPAPTKYTFKVKKDTTSSRCKVWIEEYQEPGGSWVNPLGEPTQMQFVPGTKVKVKASTSGGWDFEKWTREGSSYSLSSSSTYTHTMPSNNETLVGHFDD